MSESGTFQTKPVTSDVLVYTLTSDEKAVVIRAAFDDASGNVRVSYGGVRVLYDIDEQPPYEYVVSESGKTPAEREAVLRASQDYEAYVRGEIEAELGPLYRQVQEAEQKLVARLRAEASSTDNTGSQS